MKFKVTAREVVVALDDAPTVVGVASYSSKVRTIRPIKATLAFHPQRPDVVRITMHGPQVRPDGVETASYYEVRVDVREGDTQWLVDLVEAVRS